MRPTPLNRKPYTFEEFHDHFHAMTVVRDYQHVGMGDEEVEIGDDRSFEHNVLRVMDYMRQLYSNKDEGREKGTLLILMMGYIAQHIGDFDQTHHLFKMSNPEEPAMVSEHLLRAVHHFYTSKTLGQLGHGPDPKAVIALADDYRDKAGESK